jgi:hypothetical protein
MERSPVWCGSGYKGFFQRPFPFPRPDRLQRVIKHGRAQGGKGVPFLALPLPSSRGEGRLVAFNCAPASEGTGFWCNLKKVNNAGVGLKRSAVVFPIQSNDARGAVLTGSGLKRRLIFPSWAPGATRRVWAAPLQRLQLQQGANRPPRRRLIALVAQQGGQLAIFYNCRRSA